MGVCTGKFQLPNGSPVANGAYQFKLSSDAVQLSTACYSPRLISGNLDASGNLTATFIFNDQLLTAGGTNTSYQLTIKDSNGAQCWNESYFLTGTAANLNLVSPGTGTGIPGFIPSGFGLNLQSLNTIRFASQFTGADGGAQVAAADASLGSTAGEIWIDSGTGTTWTTAITFSGPRVLRFIGSASYNIPLGNLNMSNFPVMFLGAGRRHTQLNFTGASGIAFNCNWAQFPQGSNGDWGYGIKDMTVVGPGGINGSNANAGTGVQIGSVSNSTIGFVMENVRLEGFAIGITWANSTSWGTKLTHCSFLNNGTFSGGLQATAANFLFNLSSAGGYENLLIDHCTFLQTNASPVMTNDFVVSGTTGVLEMSCSYCSWDMSQRVMGGSNNNWTRFIGCHTELTVGTTTVPLLVSAGNVIEEVPLYVADSAATAPSQLVSVSGGSYSVSNGTWVSNKSITSCIVQSGTGNITAINALMYAILVGGITAGGSGYITWYEPGSGFLNVPGIVRGQALTATGATRTGASGELSFGTTTGVGNAAAANLQAPGHGTGSGPAALTAVSWVEIDISGTKYWFPLFQ